MPGPTSTWRSTSATENDMRDNRPPPMSEHLPGARSLRISGLMIAAGALLSGPVAMVVVSQTAPQPPWTHVDAFVDHYHPVQALPYLLGYGLLAGFVLFAASC